MTEEKKKFLTKTSLKELIGFFGVVGSLIFVGLEIRNNTMAARAGAYQQMGSSLAELWLSTGQDPDHAVLTMRFMEEPAAEFTPAEQAVLINQSVAALRLLETTWREVQLGLIEPEMMTAFGWDSNPSAAFSTNMQRLWPRIAPLMSPDFRAYLAVQFEQP